MSTSDMTEAEIRLADDKMRAEIANLNALTAKLAAETFKLNAEGRWYPIAVSTGLVGAIAAITAVVLKVFGAAFLRLRIASGSRYQH